MTSQWYTKKWFAVSMHILAWSIFFAFPFLIGMIATRNAPSTSRTGVHLDFYALIFLNNVFRCLLFYANAYLFIPRLIYEKRYSQYALAIIMCLIAQMLFDRLLFSLLIEGIEYRLLNFFVFNLPIFVFIVTGSIAFRFIHDRIRETNRIKALENENLKTELAFLRSQVSPHFMFNVLNNMVALARKKSDALEPSLIKLSQLLRYMLYETDDDKVPLENELAYLESYIDLQKQRFGKNIRINTHFGKTGNYYSIEPMLLIPFVENAFKHGTGLPDEGEITICLDVKDGILHFSVRNRFDPYTNDPKDKTSGIGLNNVKRRLNLLYNKSHTLVVSSKDGWYTVTLELNLH